MLTNVVVINPAISINTLNGNDLNILNKDREWSGSRLKKQDTTICGL